MKGTVCFKEPAAPDAQAGPGQALVSTDGTTVLRRLALNRERKDGLDFNQPSSPELLAGMAANGSLRASSPGMVS